jgi:REP element-mobilizing transposase RayT
MPRQARIDYPGAVHHVLVRGINRAGIFLDNDDRRRFLSKLSVSLQLVPLACFAWVLMPNHVHLLVRSNGGRLTVLMHKLLTGYAVYFNRRHNRVGYVFQDRFKSILCDEKMNFRRLVRYIHLNPLKAGLVKDIWELNRYPWCGHSVILGNQRADWQDVETVLASFGRTREEALKEYMDYLLEGLLAGLEKDLEGGGVIRSAGGWQGFQALRKGGERWRGDERILGDSAFVKHALEIGGERLTCRRRKESAGWTLQRLAQRVGKMTGTTERQIRSGKRQPYSAKSRAILCCWASRDFGYRLTEIADYLGVTRQAVFYALHQGETIIKAEGLQLRD